MTHQRTMLGLIRSTHRVTAQDDAYVHRVAQSRDLQEARGNIYLWRVYVLERTCVLTVALLRQRQRLARDIEAFMRGHNVSPFRESQPLDFLTSLAEDDDPLVAAVSQFELALMKVREGDEGEYAIRWPCDPAPVLHCLANEGALPCMACGSPQDAPRGTAHATHITRVARALAHGFAIEKPGVAA